MYVRGLQLYGGLDTQTTKSLFGNLEEVIQVNDGLQEELSELRDQKGEKH